MNMVAKEDVIMNLLKQMKELRLDLKPFSDK